MAQAWDTGETICVNRTTFWPRCLSQLLSVGRAYSAAPRTIVHRTEPRARNLRHWTRVLCAPHTKYKENQLLFTCKLFLSVPSHLKSRTLYHQSVIVMVWQFFYWIFCWSVKHIMAKDGPSNNEIPPYQGARPKVKYMAHVSQNSLNLHIIYLVAMYLCTFSNLKINRKLLLH